MEIYEDEQCGLMQIYRREYFSFARDHPSDANTTWWLQKNWQGWYDVMWRWRLVWNESPALPVATPQMLIDVLARRSDVMSWWNLLCGESPPSPRSMPQMLNDVMARSNSLATALDDDKEQTQKYSNKTFGTTSTVERSLTLATPTRNMSRNARTASVS